MIKKEIKMGLGKSNAKIFLITCKLYMKQITSIIKKMENKQYCLDNILKINLMKCNNYCFIISGGGEYSSFG